MERSTDHGLRKGIPAPAFRVEGQAGGDAPGPGGQQGGAVPGDVYKRQGIDITFALSDSPCMVEIQAAVTCTGVTGVEMEALTAVSVAALTIYDMCKAVQKDLSLIHIWPSRRQPSAPTASRQWPAE